MTERLFSLAALVWLLGCLALAGWAIADQQFFLAFGLAVASLFLPGLFEIWDGERRHDH